MARVFISALRATAPSIAAPKSLLVIGGGNSGLEEGLFLSQFAKRIRIVERNHALKASRLLQDKVMAHPQFEVHTNTDILELRGVRRLEEVLARDRSTGAEMRWRPAAAFVFIGLTPNTGFLPSAVDVDEWGFVMTDGAFQTSMGGIFAAGDVRTGSTKQLGSAVGDGIAALLQVRRYLEVHHHKATLAINA